MRSKIGYRDVINRCSLATCGCIHSWEGVHWWWRQNQMASVIVSKRGFLALILWVLKGRNGCRVIIRIETGHSNLVSCFGPRIRALARYFTSAFASVKYLSQRPHPRAKTWHKIWMTGLNPTSIRWISQWSWAPLWRYHWCSFSLYLVPMTSSVLYTPFIRGRYRIRIYIRPWAWDKYSSSPDDTST